MMNSPLLYVGTLFLIFCWWFSAFKQPATVITTSISKQVEHAPAQLQLPPLDRETLLKALNGDVALMQQLIFQWQLEAELAKHHGFQRVASLSSEDFWRSQLLANHLIPKRQPIEGTILPQTEFSAAVLLALLAPEEITAIPNTLRYHAQLFNKEAIDAIPLDIDRYRAEELFLKKPLLAFVAHYTEPTVLQTLRNQKIPLVSITQVNDLETICQSIQQVGEAVNCAEKAELLSLFLQAAIYAIDTHFSIWLQTHTPPERLLYLSYYRHFTTPSQKPLVGQLLKRSGLALSPLQQRALAHHDWTLPVTQEDIVADNPDLLILSSFGTNHALEQMQSSPAFATLAARQLNRIVTVEDAVQQMLSQHLVLAYLDIFQAVTGASHAQ